MTSDQDDTMYPQFDWLSIGIKRDIKGLSILIVIAFKIMSGFVGYVLTSLFAVAVSL